MLLGEHAVLHGYRALVCAVNRRIRVSLRTRSDRRVSSCSNLGEYRSDLDHLEVREPFRFVLAVLRQWQVRLPSGFDLTIRSEFSHQVGFGSSAAVTVATGAVLQKWLRGKVVKPVLFRESRAIIREVQGLGSGADVAASVNGGVVLYRAEPLEITPLDITFPLTIIYSGTKKPTAEVVRLVEAARRETPVLFESIFRLMNAGATQATTALRRRNLPAFGRLLNINQGLMDAIGVSNERLAEVVYALRADPGIAGAKISGSGLGDCVIGLGQSRRKKWPWMALPARISAKGVQ